MLLSNYFLLVLFTWMVMNLLRSLGKLTKKYQGGFRLMYSDNIIIPAYYDILVSLERKHWFNSQLLFDNIFFEENHQSVKYFSKQNPILFGNWSKSFHHVNLCNLISYSCWNMCRTAIIYHENQKQNEYWNQLIIWVVLNTDYFTLSNSLPIRICSKYIRFHLSTLILFEIDSIT